MPLSPKQKQFLANNQNALLHSTRQREAYALQQRTKQRIEELHEQDREKKQRALLKEQRDFFLNVVCTTILAFIAAFLVFQRRYLNHLKDNNLF